MDFSSFIKNNFSKKDSFEYAYDGEKMLLNGEYDKAISLYNQAIKLADDDCEFLDMYYSSRAKAKAGKKQFKGAVDDINMAIQLKPNLYLYYFERASIKEKLGDKTGYEEDLAKAFSILEKQGSAHSFIIYLANQKFKEGDYQRAADYLKNTDSLAYFNEKDCTLKYNVYNKIGDFDNCIKAIDKLIEMYPKLGLYYKAKAEILKDNGKYEEALLTIKKALELEDNNQESMFVLGEIELQIYISIGDLDNILKSLNTLISLKPERTAYLDRKTDILLKLGKEEEAYKTIKKAMEIEPDNDHYRIVAENINTNICDKKGDTDNLLKSLDILIRLEPDRTCYLDRKSDVLRQKGKYQEALDTINKALKIEPDNEHYKSIRDSLSYSLAHQKNI